MLAAEPPNWVRFALGCNAFSGAINRSVHTAPVVGARAGAGSMPSRKRSTIAHEFGEAWLRRMVEEKAYSLQKIADWVNAARQKLGDDAVPAELKRSLEAALEMRIGLKNSGTVVQCGEQ